MRLRNSTRYRGPLSDFIDQHLEAIKYYIANRDVDPSFYRLSLDGKAPPHDARAIERADVVAIISEAEFAWQTKGRMHSLEQKRSHERVAEIAPLFAGKPLVLLTADRADTPQLFRERTFAGVDLGAIGEVDEADAAFGPGLGGSRYWFVKERAGSGPKGRDIQFCYWGASNKRHTPDGKLSGDERDVVLLAIRKQLGPPPGSCFIGSFKYKDIGFNRDLLSFAPWAHRAAYTLCFNWLEPEALTARYFEAIALGVAPLTFKQYGGALVPREFRVFSAEQALARVQIKTHAHDIGVLERHLLARLPSLPEYHARYAARLDEEIARVTERKRTPIRNSCPDTNSAPMLEEHSGVLVVRDDLYPGGTKARFIPQLFEDADEVVYASPAQGGAQYALAFCAKQLGKRVTIFVAKREQPHPRQFEAKALGAKIVLVPFGMLSNVQAKARDYARKVGARLAPFGMDTPEAIKIIADAARATGVQPDEVWCAAGSGTLSRSLQEAWPRARHVAVAVGRNIPRDKLGKAQMIRYARPFEHAAPQPPFPADPHYEAKAWELLIARRRAGQRYLFWNVCGPAQTGPGSLTTSPPIEQGTRYRAFSGAGLSE